MYHGTGAFGYLVMHREFQLAMRKVDAPGAEFPVVRLATARASSMPNLELAAHLDVSKPSFILAIDAFGNNLSIVDASRSLINVPTRVATHV